MTENKKAPEDNDAPAKPQCPVNETWRHILYIGGMVALHTGLGATAVVSSKSHKCPVSEWSRHAVYTGAVIALFAMMGKTPQITASEKTTTTKEEPEKKWYEVCPLNEWGKHAVYVASMVGIVALINARKK
uniref:Uncharacterized protein n=1 Tax=Amphora coffeiformis TaxID=265554 RepID=A0A7S3KXY1_9STRA|mmetsp:Transcript_11386/g.21739  ORF Transcript_11386/g.21739 Transcript_11386/m.21739 type:complete len:131 (-) Transcript_11386:80-472(-)|eukprot:scaffold1181_cov152-Amphora_coffeaeformis.AAC.6